MPLAAAANSKLIDYSILHDARPIGACIGSIAGCKIFEAVVDERGQRYAYSGIAPRRVDNRFDVEALKSGEFIVLPGLVYRLESMSTPWWERLLGTRSGVQARGRD